MSIFLVNKFFGHLISEEFEKPNNVRNFRSLSTSTSTSLENRSKYKLLFLPEYYLIKKKIIDSFQYRENYDHF